MEIENEQKEISTEDLLKKRIKYKPIKDSIIIACCIFIVVIIFLSTFLSKPKAVLSHVEIRYQNTLLYDKDDESKNTAISFPSVGEKRLEFRKEDGKIFLEDGKDFDFIGEYVAITLYADKSIQIKSDDVTCPDHTCSKMGKMKYTFTPIVCLPNKIQAMIVADGLPEYDA